MIISLAKLSGGSLLLLTLILPPSVAAAQTMDAGQKAFQACAACHDVGEAARSKVGPPLNGVFGRGAASVQGFTYSDALRSSGIVWDDAAFQRFMTNPQAMVPGTKMAFAGIKDESAIAALAGYLKAFDATGKFTPPTPPVSTAEDSNPNPQTLACVESFGTADAREKCGGVGGELLQAIGAVIAGAPMSGFGTFDGDGLVDRDVTGDTKFFSRLAPTSADGCSVELTEFHQDSGSAMPELEISEYDFHKIGHVGYLAQSPGNFPGKTVPESDPAMNTVNLEGQGLVCHETVTLDPAGANTGQVCDDQFQINAYSPENLHVVLPALDTIRKACGLPK